MENGEIMRSVEKSEIAKIKNVFELDSTEKQELKNRIMANNGSMIIFVHPFDNLNCEPRREAVEKFKINDSKIANVSGGFYKLLEKNKLEDKPIIVFEEDQFLRDTASFVKNKATKNNVVYMMPTQEGSPEPEDKNGNWSGLTNLLNEVGVNEVVIGGKYLLIENNDFDGCVGETVKKISAQGIKVKITELCHPDHGEEKMF